ncbi:MAG: DUF2155 domain-containing protein [Nitrospirae bacterium]|nr:DUF2155 domain-containing protein [Nitrospirota bacterium]
MKKILSLSISIMILLSFASCSKKEEAPVSQPAPPIAQGPIVESPATPPGHPAAPAQKVEYTVVVPPDVKGKWDAVKLSIEDMQLTKTQEYTVKLGSELKIPNSNLTVKVGEFLPDFKLEGTTITSASNMLNNPAVGVMITENGAQVFPATGKWGWLYAKHPTIHPFQHNRFRVLLKEGVAQ